MSKRKSDKDTGRIPKEIVEKAVTLDILRRKYYAMKEEVEELARELRDYVTENPTGTTDKRMPKIENRAIEVWLEANQRIHIQPKEFYKLLGDDAFDFMEVKRKQAEEAMKNNLLAADPNALDRLPTTTEFLEPRVKVNIKVKKEAFEAKKIKK